MIERNVFGSISYLKYNYTDNELQTVRHDDYSTQFHEYFTDEQFSLAFDAMKVFEKMSCQYQETFWKGFKSFKGHISSHHFNEAASIIEKYKFDLPIFNVIPNSFTSSLMEEAKLQPYINTTNHLVTVFSLPKPVSQFWFKSNKDSMFRDIHTQVNVLPDIIPWGMVYRQTVPVIQDEINTINKDNQKGSLNFVKLNPDKHHIPNFFYYIWDVSYKPAV